MGIPFHKGAIPVPFAAIQTTSCPLFTLHVRVFFNCCKMIALPLRQDHKMELKWPHCFEVLSQCYSNNLRTIKSRAWQTDLQGKKITSGSAIAIYTAPIMLQYWKEDSILVWSCLHLKQFQNSPRTGPNKNRENQ